MAFTNPSHCFRAPGSITCLCLLSKKKQQREQDIEAKLEAEAKATADAEEKARLDLKAKYRGSPTCTIFQKLVHKVVLVGDLTNKFVLVESYFT